MKTRIRFERTADEGLVTIGLTLKFQVQPDRAPIVAADIGAFLARYLSPKQAASILVEMQAAKEKAFFWDLYT